MRWARLWLSAPDPNDGIYIEILESLTPKSKLEVQVDAAWFLDEAQCREWATLQGATRVETI